MSEEKKVSAALAVTMAVAETIRALGQVPNGHLYVQLMDKLDFETYTAIIQTIKSAGLIDEKNHLLIWKGKS